MCGIVGYIGNRDKKQIILHGLKELEYRGYDSAGIAILQNNELKNFRALGKLANLETKLQDSEFIGYGLAIGHTRWATHGRPSEINAHPHQGQKSAVIHNGIIENYKELKSELESQGIVFASQTDTEVIVHLFEFYLAQEIAVIMQSQQHTTKLHTILESTTPQVLESMLQTINATKDSKTSYNILSNAFAKTIKRLEGAFAILLITEFDTNRIFYAKNHSPLIAGINSKQNGDDREDIVFFASSDSALIGLVDKVVYFEDGEYGSIGSDFDTLKNIQPFHANKISAQKEGYRYFMEKEIYEQERVLLETIMGRVSEESIGLEELDSDFFNRFKHIAICACGTSHHSALVGKYLIERKARVRVSTHIASEFRYAKPVLDKDELFIAISQSGETADTLQALKLAKDEGLTTLVICNVDNSSMVRLADYCLLTRAGIEKGVASTKAFATQVMVLWIFAVILGIKRNKIDSIGIKSETQAMLNAIKATKVESLIHEKIKRLSKRYLHGHGFFFIGRDIFYPLALEGALKLKEISYLHAEGYPSGEMKHGPIALADSELFTLALMPKNLLYEKNKSNVEELIARDSTICAITPFEFDLADDIVKIPIYKSYMEEFFSMMVILQLLALEIAVRLKNDVDMPRNLAKSVTVE